MAQNILVLHGPNLNLLGTREPHIYGSLTLQQINENLERLAGNWAPRSRRGRAITRAHWSIASRRRGKTARTSSSSTRRLTHTSVAVRDALAGVAIPFIEVHLSNLYKREPFRHHSYLSDLAVGLISGLGADGYEAALLRGAALISLQHIAFTS